MSKFKLNKYFFIQFIIYFLIISWFVFIQIDSTADKLTGKEVKSTVHFIYGDF